MISTDLSPETVPFRISCSTTSTAANKTGSWRFVQPKYEEKTAPCSGACPVGEDIARIEMLVHQRAFDTAVQTVLKENPFPAVCGRVCFHPCESVCNRQGLDEPVAVHQIERFLGDFALGSGAVVLPDMRPSNGRRVGIVGAGPSGLAAAWFLTLLGFQCDVHEAAAEPGGVLRWGIPEYRLPEDILKSEIERIRNLGVTIHCSTPVTEGVLEDFKHRYDALFIGCGHGRSIQLNIPGQSEASDGLAFLSGVRRGEIVSAKGVSAVVGGGNTAVDVARTIRRLGGDVVILYRRRKMDMPAFSHEVDAALSEGVRLMELVAPIRIENHNRRLDVALQKMKLSGKEIDGRRRVVPCENPLKDLHVNRIFTAIGAHPGDAWQVPSSGENDSLNLSHCVLVTQGVPTVFGGDLTNSVQSVTDAVASGKQAAMVLDTLFHEGRDNIEGKLAYCSVGEGSALSMEIYCGGERRSRHPHVVSFEEINTDYFQPLRRVVPKRIAPTESAASFSEIEKTLGEDSASGESDRCFNCGICNDCDNCRLFCPEVAVILENVRRIDLDYCKGCGICVVECPRNAMALKEETS